MTERTSAWSFAPQTDRKQLVTLRKTALQRSACSEPLLVGAASGSTRKTNSLPCHLTKLRRNFSVATLPTIGCATISESARKVITHVQTALYRNENDGKHHRAPSVRLEAGWPCGQ